MSTGGISRYYLQVPIGSIYRWCLKVLSTGCIYKTYLQVMSTVTIYSYDVLTCRASVVADRFSVLGRLLAGVEGFCKTQTQKHTVKTVQTNWMYTYLY